MLLKELEGKTPLGKYRYRWEDDLKIYYSSNVWEYSVDLSTSTKGQMTAICEQGDEFLDFVSNRTTIS